MYTTHIKINKGFCVRLYFSSNRKIEENQRSTLVASGGREGGKKRQQVSVQSAWLYDFDTRVQSVGSPDDVASMAELLGEPSGRCKNSQGLNGCKPVWVGGVSRHVSWPGP